MAIRARRTTITIVVATLLFLAGHTLIVVLRHGFDVDDVGILGRLTYLDSERTLPTAFSSGVLLAAGALFAILWRRRRGTPGRRRAWLILAVVFVFLAVDEALAIHEQLTEPARSALDSGGLLYFAWVVPYLVGVLALGALVGRSVLALPRRHLGWFITAAAVYGLGAVILEMLGGRHLEANAEVQDLTYVLYATSEETLELAGVAILLFALLRLLEETGGPVTLNAGWMPSTVRRALAGLVSGKPAAQYLPAD